ncbi:OadG family transporter subunit [Pisciglobus halotolerans]|uniref:Oxaloacetate decarboxylase, gamma chain n=1 Tax=Pisciglobus halotolerans TaxID=745365 RepID=A0A1I3BP18_9LACT|nr:OadG family transporter subunit [Pisciglobus halotolerans]SFH64035.1 Oxaloacetate decarboxylase, gamma chain [Pisciglobus halotolerans]
MTNISLLKGINISVTSIVMVFLVLLGLQLILTSFKYIFREEKEKLTKTENAPIQTKKDSLEEDEETKMVAALTALILANEDQQDKHYQVTSIKRVK